MSRSLTTAGVEVRSSSRTSTSTRNPRPTPGHPHSTRKSRFCCPMILLTSWSWVCSIVSNRAHVSSPVIDLILSVKGEANGILRLAARHQHSAKLTTTRSRAVATRSEASWVCSESREGEPECAREGSVPSCLSAQFAWSASVRPVRAGRAVSKRGRAVSKRGRAVGGIEAR